MLSQMRNKQFADQTISNFENGSLKQDGRSVCCEIELAYKNRSLVLDYCDR